jgi:hypothetical protein
MLGADMDIPLIELALQTSEGKDAVQYPDEMPGRFATART